MASILRFDNWQNSDGTSIATTNASGDITFAGGVSGAGKILQVVRATDSTNRSTTSATFVDAGISVTITPQRSDSAIIIIWSFNIRPPSNYWAWTIITDSSDNSLVGDRGVSGSSNGTSEAVIVTQIAYDTPATTSATTYKGRFLRETSGTATIYNSTWMTGQMFAIEVSA